MKIARMRRAIIVVADRRSEHRHRDAVPAALDAKGMQRLVHVAHEVDEELQRDSPVSAVERRVCQTLLDVANPVDDAVPPRVTTATCGHARLSRAVAVAVVARRLRRDVDVVPEGRLVDAEQILVGPHGHICQRLVSQQCLHLLPRSGRQVVRGYQRHQPVALGVPGANGCRREEREGGETRHRESDRRNAAARRIALHGRRSFMGCGAPRRHHKTW
jgi:hypothetical protein